METAYKLYSLLAHSLAVGFISILVDLRKYTRQKLVYRLRYLYKGTCILTFVKCFNGVSSEECPKYWDLSRLI